MHAAKHNLVLFSFLICFGLCAQQNDPKAAKILDDLYKKTSAYTTVIAEFRMVMLKKDEKTADTLRSRLWLKGDKYRLELPNTTLIGDSSTQVTIDSLSKEYSIQPRDPGDKDLHPSEWLVFYRKDLQYKYDKEIKLNGMRLAVIDLYAAVRPEKKKYSKIKLYIDCKDMTMRNADFMMKDGSLHTLEILKIDPNVEIDDSLFDLKRYIKED
jgi:outer membrane lipoprotein-sorting protein